MPENAQPLCSLAGDCPFYQGHGATPSSGVLKKIYCHGDPSRCEIRTRRLAGKTIPQNMLPDGSVDA